MSAQPLAHLVPARTASTPTTAPRPPGGRARRAAIARRVAALCYGSLGGGASVVFHWLASAFLHHCGLALW